MYRRLRRSVEAAIIHGTDIEQTLAELDDDGDHHILASQFREVLKQLSQHSQLSPSDIAITIKRFGETATTRVEEGQARISLREVMSFLGKQYIGNVDVRLKELVRSRMGETETETVAGDAGARMRNLFEHYDRTGSKHLVGILTFIC